MTVAQLERSMDMPEFVRWIGFYRYRKALRDREETEQELIEKAKSELRRR